MPTKKKTRSVAGLERDRRIHGRECRLGAGRPARARRASPTPEVGYVCGHLDLQRADGTSREGRLLALGALGARSPSRARRHHGRQRRHHAVRREDYRESDPRMGHDLGFPYTLAQNGRRCVYEPAARAFEKAPRSSARTSSAAASACMRRGWTHILSGRMFRPGRAALPDAARLAQGAPLPSGLLHLGLFGSSVALAGRGASPERPSPRSSPGSASPRVGVCACRSLVRGSPTTTC